MKMFSWFAGALHVFSEVSVHWALSVTVKKSANKTKGVWGETHHQCYWELKLHLFKKNIFSNWNKPEIK